MPGMDGTGPEGKGPATGRRLGKCVKQPPENEQSQLGRGLGRRFKMGGGQGRGQRHQSGQR